MEKYSFHTSGYFLVIRIGDSLAAYISTVLCLITYIYYMYYSVYVIYHIIKIFEKIITPCISASWVFNLYKPQFPNLLVKVRVPSS